MNDPYATHASHSSTRNAPPATADPFASFFTNLADGVSGLKGDDKHAYDDLDFYSRYVIGYGNKETVPNSPFITSIYNTLQYEDTDVLILGPRGSAKSTAVTVTATSWWIGRDPLLRILLAVASQEQTGLAFVRQLQTIITTNERYLKIFGELKPTRPERWTSTEFIVKRPEPPSGLKDASIAVVGLGTAVPSKRADIVVCDDLVNQNNAYSDIERRNVIRFVFQTLFPILVPGGRRVILGSRWEVRDLYAYAAAQWGLTFPPLETLDFSTLRAINMEKEVVESI